jgi:guanine nucleotide-binding protein subunit alpha
LQEALALFEQSVNSQYLGQAQHNLCFTKMDIFEGKVRSGTNPISDVFPEYSGSTTDVDAVRDFITAKFTQLLKCSAPRELRVYYLNAVDREEVRQVMGNILERADMFAPHFTFTKYPE